MKYHNALLLRVDELDPVDAARILACQKESPRDKDCPHCADHEFCFALDVAEQLAIRAGETS